LDSSIKVALLDSSNRVLETKTLSGIDPFSWKPGQTITSTTSFTFSNIAGGTKIAIGLFAETSASNPNVKFAVANPLSSGWYILGQETELLSNSGFETGNATGWTSGVSMSVNTAYKYSGSYGLMISNRQATWDSVSQNIISVLNNKGKGNYDASAWMKLANGSDSYSRITIVLQTTANPNPVYYDIGATNINTNWKKLSGTVNLTWSGTLTNASIYYQTNTSLANLYLDELSLIKK